jgi:DNA repair protein SbcC/Rad50
MKIIKLQIENIASLKGKHVIDFQNIFQHSGVFAITGETGSGKSTILNCISLALYGVNYKNNRNRDFVTLGESFGEIELVFSLENSIYKAHWMFKLLKNDGSEYKTPKPEKHFYRYQDNQWEALAETPEKILGLTFDQFSKTIILNQGEFAKFLTSSFKERKDILAKLYDEDKLDALSIHVRRKITTLEQQIQNHQSQITGLDEMSSLDLDLAYELIKQDQSKLEHVKLYTDLFDKIKKIFRDLYQYKELWNKTNLMMEKSSHSILLATDEINKYKIQAEDIHNQAQKIKLTLENREPLLIEAIGKINLLKNLELQQSKLSAQHQDFSAELVTLTNKRQTHQQLKVTTENNLQQLMQEQFKAEINEKNLVDIDKYLKQNQQKMSELSLLERDLHFENQKVNDLYEQLNELTRNFNEKSESLKGLNLNHCQAMLKKSTTENDQYQKAQLALEQYQKDFKTLQKDENHFEKLLYDINFSIQKSQALVDETKLQISDIELALKGFEIQLAIDHLSLESLKIGHCLVCQSNDLTNVQKENRENHQSEIKRLQERLQDKNNILNKESLQLNTYRTSQMHFRSTLKEFHHKRLELAANITGSFSFISSTDLESLDTTMAEIKNFLTTTNKHKIEYENKIQQAYLLQEQIKDTERLTQLKKQDEIHLSKNIETLTLKKENIQKAINHISQSLKVLVPNFNSIDELEDVLDIAKQKNMLRHEIDNQDKHIVNYQSQIERTQKLLTQNLLFSDENQKQRDEIAHFIKAHQILNPQVELDDLKRSSLSFQQQSQQLNNLILHLNTQIVEENSKLKTYQEQNEQTEFMFKTIWNNFLSIINLETIKNFPIENAHEIYQKVHLFFDRIQKSLTIQDSSIEIIALTQDHTNQLFNELAELKLHLQAQLTRNQTLIENKLEAKQKIDVLERAIKDIQETKQKLTNLYDLVGKDEFRNFVLALIEKNLIIQTNNELKNLCDDRYQIEHMSKTSTESPEFYVIDKLKGGLTRKVSTLSGGETFMVSLAMAMALAELTRGQSEIDSFFIDEGFGTLDEDSLEDVLEMIHTMENRGKSIGLISHIKRLTDRINVNIKLEKTDIGNSSIKVLYL